MSNKLTLSASDRISSLLDEASFVEVGAYVTARNTDFNMQENDTPKDGVILRFILRIVQSADESHRKPSTNCVLR